MKRGTLNGKVELIDVIEVEGSIFNLKKIVKRLIFWNESSFSSSLRVPKIDASFEQP